MRILITGIAGSGKTTAIKHLIERGFPAIDLDNSGLCAWVNKHSGEETDYVEGAGKEWIENHRWQVIVPKLLDYLNASPIDKHIIVGGKIAKAQADEIVKIFDLIYLLQPTNEVIDERLAIRQSNIKNFGKKKDERETILNNRNRFEEKCISIGAIPIENNGSVEDLIQKITERL